MKRSQRIALAIGLALLVGGWSLIGYAKAQQQTASIDRGTRYELWTSGRFTNTNRGETLYGSYPSRIYYASGCVMMIVGAGLFAYSFPFPPEWK